MVANLKKKISSYVTGTEYDIVEGVTVAMEDAICKTNEMSKVEYSQGRIGGT